jgi:hypothetical protein
MIVKIRKLYVYDGDVWWLGTFLKHQYGRVFKVIDEKLFMLAVVKYGIEFTEIKENNT